jgi:hypothetical protein
MHTFVVDDQNHPQISEIHAQLKRLSGWIHEEGYLTKVEFVLHNVEEEVEKVSIFCHHSEKLAIALNGLISTHTSLYFTFSRIGFLSMWAPSYGHKVHLLEDGSDDLHS